MTHAGTITVGVDIDGGDLGAKLAAEVRKSLAPMLADIQASMAKTNKSLTGLDGAGLGNIAAEADKAAKATEATAKATEKAATSTEKAAQATDKAAKSTDKATASTKRQTSATTSLANATNTLKNAQEDFTASLDLYGRKSPQAESAYRRLTRAQTTYSNELVRAKAASTSSTDSQINDFDRLARAAEDSAARQAKAARSAGIGGGGGGGRGGGFGGGRGGGGGFLSPGMLNLGALGAAGLPAAATAVVNLTAAVQTLGQAGLAIPGIFAGIASSAGTAALGFHGMSDAVTALNKAAESGKPADMLKAVAALKDMDPAAIAVAKSISTLTQGPLKDLRKQIQGNMFVDVDKSIDDLSAKTFPTLTKGLGGIGTAWNNTFKELGRVGGLDSTQSFLDKIFGNTADAQNRANGVIAPLTHAFGQLAATGSDFLPRLGDGLTKLGTRFDAFITKSAGNGDLDKWINEGFDAVSNLGTAFLNVGKIITDITGAEGDGGGFLKWLADVTGQLHTFLSSTDGQNKLKAFFDDGKKSLDQWFSTIKSLIPLAGQVIQGFQQWGDILLPVIKQIADTLTSLGGDSGLIAGIVTAFVGWKSISGIASLLGDLGKVDAALGSTGGGGILGKLGKAGLVAGGAGLLAGANLTGTPGASGGDQALGLAANVGGGALIGAQVGGPWGAAIGAVIGAGLDLFENAKRQLDEGKAEWDKKWDEDQKNPEHIAQQKAKDDLALKPLLASPSIPDSLIPKIKAGDVKGFTIGPDGQIIGPDGKPVNGLPTNLTTPPPLPPPPGPPPPPLAPNFTTGVPTGSGIDQQTIDKTKNALNEIRDQVAQGFNGSITLTDPTPAIIDRLRDLGVKITQLPDGKFRVDPIGLDDALNKASNLNGQIGQFAGKTFTAHVEVTGQVSVPNAITNGGPGGNQFTPHKAGGGVFPGYAPGRDSILSWMSPGEGVLIPEAVRAIGGGPGVYAINSMFRGGLSRAGYSGGGVIPGFADGGLGVDLTTGQGTGPIPGPTPDNSVIGLLSQIRDLLAGKSTGTSGNPLAQTADGVQSLVQGANGATGVAGKGTGTQIGPFGTPLKKKGDPAYEMAAAAISALGGDPERFLGTDPTLTPAAGVGGTAVAGSVAAALKAFATSGSTDALAGTGLGINDPVISALTSARAKKKGGLSDDQISGLVDQVFTGGGFSGTLDASNTPLVKALTRFRDKGAKGTSATTATAAAGATLPTDGSVPATATDLSSAAVTTAGATQSVFVTNWPGQAATGQNGQPALGPDGLPIAGTTHGTNAGAAAGPGGATNFPGKSIIDAATQATGGVASDVAGQLIDAVANGTDLKTGTPTNPNTNLSQLLKEGNPAALASAFGLQVPDFTRQGGGGGDIEKNTQSFDSKGRMYSDTGSLIDRTMSDLQTQLTASLDQQKAILNDIKDRVSEAVLKPIVSAAVTEGISQLSNAVTNKIGQSVGTSAAPAIADAVKDAVPASTGTSSTDGSSIAIPVPNLFDEGGIMPHNSTGINLSGSPERVLSPSQTQLFDSGLLGGWNMQPQQQHFASVAGVSGNDTVGADFFGVSQVPIIGAIVNALVKTLLSLIGVNIEERDTLDEMSDSVRQFRGDFQKFDASGRLFNDTSGLVDRSSSSEQEAADERIRILKTVIEGLVKFIIEKIIIPIAKAVADAAIQAGGAAAGAAVNTQAPGAGGIVSALISGAGTAGVDIVGDLVGDFASSITPVIIDLISDGLQTLAPDLISSIFGGGLLENLLVGPITSIFSGIFGPLLGSVAGGIFAPFTALLGAVSFDDGGVASGVGVMPKATIAPERVLSPRQTDAFERLVSSLDRGAGVGGNSRSVSISGGMHFHGQDAPKDAHDKLLALLGA